MNIRIELEIDGYTSFIRLPIKEGTVPVVVKADGKRDLLSQSPLVLAIITGFAHEYMGDAAINDRFALVRIEVEN